MKYAVLDNVRKKKKTYVNLIMLESGVKVVNYCIFGEGLQVDKVRHPHCLQQQQFNNSRCNIRMPQSRINDVAT